MKEALAEAVDLEAVDSEVVDSVEDSVDSEEDLEDWVEVLEDSLAVKFLPKKCCVFNQYYLNIVVYD